MTGNTQRPNEPDPDEQAPTVSDDRTQYDEVTNQQANTVRIEPGAMTDELGRERAAPHKLIATGEQDPAGETEAPREDGTYGNQFSREGARIHGTADDRDKPYEYRDSAWQPDETKEIALDATRDDDEPGSAHAP